MTEFDPTTLTWTGALPMVLLASAGFAFPLSLWLLSRYRRTVIRSMDSRKEISNPDIREEPSSHQIAPLSALQVRMFDSRTLPVMDVVPGSTGDRMARSLKSSVSVYACAGVAFSILMTIAYLLSEGHGFNPFNVGLLFTIFLWPLVPTLDLILTPTGDRRLLLPACYAVAFVVVAGIDVAAHPKVTWLQAFQSWSILSLGPSVFLISLLHRRIRAIGPLVFAFFIPAFAGEELMPHILFGNRSVFQLLIKMGGMFGMNGYALFIGAKLLGFLLFGVVGWLILSRVRRLYELKSISDQSIVLDTLWLFFSIAGSIGMVFKNPLWMMTAPFAFALYRGVIWLGFGISRIGGKKAGAGSTLLLLRVFSLGKRSEQLFHALSARWRHAGGILLLAGPDLAKTTVQPHEFLDYVSGKLSRQFIDGKETLNRRIEGLDLKPDGDGRFRVNDFFCFEETWKDVLNRLLEHSNAVLMDLRSFSRGNSGCIHEIRELIDKAPVGRVVFLIDASTDEKFLREVLDEAWRNMKTDSPNRLGPSPVHIYSMRDSRGRSLDGLLRILANASDKAEAGESRFIDSMALQEPANK